MAQQKYNSLNKTSSEAVEKATGKNWDYWIELIDKEGGAQSTHKEIARMLYDKGYITKPKSWPASRSFSVGWWCQQVTVGYEYAKDRRILGQTEGVGYEIGVSKSIPVSAEKLWKFLMSPEGVNVWLGKIDGFKLEKGYAYETKEKTQGEIRTINPGLKVRLTYQTKPESPLSTLQIYLMANGEYNSRDKNSTKTSLRFHHEKLQNKAEREAMKTHWEEVIEEIEKHI